MEPNYIPPFDDVRLVECRDFIALTPVPAFREFFAYGKKKAREVTIDLPNGGKELFWDDCTEEEEVWAVVQWIRFEDGRDEEGSVCYLRRSTEAEARERMQEMIQFYSMTRNELVRLSQCFKATAEDLDYIDNRHPNYQHPPAGPGTTEIHDLYQARLKALAGICPETVRLIKSADNEKDPQKRKTLEREAVQAYFAELAHHWTEDQVLAWQRTNPLGTRWIAEFTKVFQEPEREIDPIKYELVLNWLRKNYNLLTAAELSDAILVATGQRVGSGTLKKQRERLGLTTARPPGPRPKDEQ